MARSFLDVAVENMSSAIKKITTYKGFELEKYTLLVLGSASGQLACEVAEKLKIKKLYFIHYQAFYLHMEQVFQKRVKLLNLAVRKFLIKKI